MHLGWLSCQNTHWPILSNLVHLYFSSFLVHLTGVTAGNLSWIHNKPSFMNTHADAQTLALLSPFSVLRPSEPVLYWVKSVCLENIYFDLFYGSPDALQLWAVMCLIDNEWKGKQRERGLGRKRVWAGESCLYLIMMTHWFRSVCHNLSGEGKHLTRSGHSLVPACFN